MIGWGYFSPDKFRLFNNQFLAQFFKYDSEGIVVLSFILKRYVTSDHFSLSNGGLKIAFLANMGQLKSDTFCAINA